MINKVILSGRLTDAPELRYTTSGIAVASFTLAVRRNYDNSYGERDTDFFRIIVWRQLAELCQRYLQRGDKPTVIGRLQVRSFTAKDGSDRKAWEIIAEEIDFPAKSSAAAEQPSMEEERPFGAGCFEEAGAEAPQNSAEAENGAEDQQLILF